MADIVLKTDPELRAFLPDLDRETKAMLEDSIKKAGKARQPIEIWKGKDIIVDGHNRYEICTRLGLPFTTLELDFDNKQEAKAHMLDVQISRRNLTREQASKYRGQYVRMLRVKRASTVAAGLPVPAVSVAEQAAEDLNVAPATAKRDAQFVEGLTELEKTQPDEAKKVEKGKSKINKGAIEKIGTAKDKPTKKAAVDTAMKQATRTHKKEVVEPKGASAYGKSTVAEMQDFSILVEKIGLFLKAKTIAGRRQLIKDVIKAMSELGEGEFTVPAEYENDNKTKPANGNGKAKNNKDTPPPLKVMACDD